VPHFGEFLARSSDAIFVVGPGFRIVWWGPRAEEMLDVSAKRVVGRRCIDVFAGSLATGKNICGAGCWVAKALRRGETVPAFCVDVCLEAGALRAFTLGFLTDESGVYLTHILRERPPGMTTGDASRPGRAELVSLTRRQHQVLLLIMSGANSREIGTNLGVTHATARNHIQNLLDTLGVHSRLEAALLAERAGVVPPQ
jgi:DNA-binding CsgD family transcriptional regulator